MGALPYYNINIYNNMKHGRQIAPRACSILELYGDHAQSIKTLRMVRGVCTILRHYFLSEGLIVMPE